jgi:hypothetical protein
MRKYYYKVIGRVGLTLLAVGTSMTMMAQDTTATVVEEPEAQPQPAKIKPVKNTFQSIWIIDNQTVMVPVKKTFEMDIMHRFGTVGNGYEDFWGMFAPSNIRIGVSYSPINKLNLGMGITKGNMLWDFSAKYGILQQMKGMPVSVTWYSNFAYDTRKDPDGSLFRTDKLDEKGDFFAEKFNMSTDRMKTFNQLIIARKITPKLSLQLAPGWTHQNAVMGYYERIDSATKVVKGQMKHDHFAISLAGRYKLTEVTSVIFNYDQPLTKHKTSNPSPNISFGLEFNTSNHAFQLFLGNYSFLNPQRNNLENQNYYKNEDGKISIRQFLIGFNVTRLWNY